MLTDRTSSSSVPAGGESTEPSLAYWLLRYLWRKTNRRLRHVICATTRVTRNALMCWVGRADNTRWTSPQGLEGWWDERTKMIAALVPARSRVIEFGAGRRQLEKLLPEGCTYTPSDLVDRGPDTIVCDLNHRPLPDLSHVTPEVSVFGGVLEYIRDVPSLVRWLADAGVTTCVVSFDPVPSGLGIIERCRESLRRVSNGYMNTLTEDELQRIFEAAGFACTQRQTWTMPRQTWKIQVILRFLKQPCRVR